MTFSVMSDVPNPIIVDAAGTAGSGYVLKAYLPGTTTSTSIAIDSSGGSPQTSLTANAEGKWEVTGNEILPYIDRKHKWGIFANAVDAAANTPFYMGPFDNVEQTTDALSIKSASLINYEAGNNFTGGVDRTQEDKNAEILSPLDFGGANDGTDVAGTTAAFVALFGQLTDNSFVRIAPGTYLINTNAIGCALNNVVFEAYGVTFLTNSTTADGVLFDLNTAANHPNDEANIKRNIKWFGGRLLNANGNQSATNNTATAIKTWAVRDLTIQGARLGSGDTDFAGHGWNKGIDPSGFDAIRILDNQFFGNDFHIHFNTGYLEAGEPILQNVHINRNNFSKSFSQAVYLDTPISDLDFSFNDSSQSGGAGLIRIPTGNGAGGRESKGIRILNNNTEVLQDITKALIDIVQDGAHIATDIDIMDNTLTGANLNIRMAFCGGKIQIKGNNFNTAAATAITGTSITGSVTIEDNDFAQDTDAPGILVNMQFDGSAYDYNWGKNNTSKSKVGAVTWSHTSGLSTVDRFRRTDCPILFGTVRDGVGTAVTQSNIQSAVFNATAGAPTVITNLAPLTDIGSANLFAHNNNINLITAVLIRIKARDSGSLLGTAGVLVYPKGFAGTFYAPLEINLTGQPDDEWVSAEAWVPLGTDLEISVDATESGAGLIDVGIAYMGFK